MNRRELIRTAGGAMLLFPVLASCYGTSGGDDNDSPGSAPLTTATNVTYTSSVEDGHDHTYVIAMTAFTAPTNIGGQTSFDDGHTHAVAITADELSEVEAGKTVMITTSSAEGHTHLLTLTKVD